MLNFLPDAGPHNALSLQPSLTPGSQADGRALLANGQNPNGASFSQDSITELPSSAFANLVADLDTDGAGSPHIELVAETPPPIANKSALIPVADVIRDGPADLGDQNNPAALMPDTEISPKPDPQIIAESPDQLPLVFTAAEIVTKAELTPIADRDGLITPDNFVPDTDAGPTNSKTPLTVIAETPTLAGVGRKDPVLPIAETPAPTADERPPAPIPAGLATVDGRDVWQGATPQTAPTVSKAPINPHSAIPVRPETPHRPPQVEPVSGQTILTGLIGPTRTEAPLSLAPTTISDAQFRPDANPSPTVSANSTPHTDQNTNYPQPVTTASLDPLSPLSGPQASLAPHTATPTLQPEPLRAAPAELNPTRPTETVSGELPLRDAQFAERPVQDRAASQPQTSPSTSASTAPPPAVLPVATPVTTVSPAPLAQPGGGPAINIFTPPVMTALPELPQTIVATALTAQRAMIQIDPPELGRIQIDTAFESGQRTRILLIPETEAARIAMTDRLPTLVSLFESHHSSPVNVEIGRSDQFEQDAAFDQAAFFENSSGEAREQDGNGASSDDQSEELWAENSHNPSSAALTSQPRDGRNGNRLHLRI